MSWKTWCSSSYNTSGYVCFAGARVIKYDLNTTKLEYISKMEYNAGSVNVITVYGTDIITSGATYNTGSTTGTNFVLLPDKSFTSASGQGYTTYTAIADAIKNGTLLGAICPGGLFDSYEDCMANINIYIKANGTLQASPLTYTANIMAYKVGDAITISLTGVPTTTKWYKASASHEPSGSVRATGTS